MAKEKKRAMKKLEKQVKRHVTQPDDESTEEDAAEGYQEESSEETSLMATGGLSAKDLKKMRKQKAGRKPMTPIARGFLNG